MTIKCYAVGTVLDKLYIIRDTDEEKTVICYVSCPYGRDVRKILRDKLPPTWYVARLDVRQVKDYRRCDQIRGIEMIRANSQVDKVTFKYLCQFCEYISEDLTEFRSIYVPPNELGYSGHMYICRDCNKHVVLVR